MKIILLILLFAFSFQTEFAQNSKKVELSPKSEAELDWDKTMIERNKSFLKTHKTKGWIIYDESESAVSLYNGSTIVRKKESVKVWLKFFISSIDSYSMHYMEINCREHEARLLHSEKDLLENMPNTNFPTKFRPISPDSSLKTLERKICRIKSK